MRDLDRFTELLESLGVDYLKQDADLAEVHAWKLPTPPHTEVVMEGIGYTGFYTAWYFNADGKYLGHGEWE